MRDQAKSVMPRVRMTADTRGSGHNGRGERLLVSRWARCAGGPAFGELDRDRAGSIGCGKRVIQDVQTCVQDRSSM